MNMATRATYQIDGTTFYIHHDGYPEGAAKYFEKALIGRHKGSGNFADAFIRANLNAEITASHATHPDTEYRYDVKTKSGNLVLSAQARRFDQNDPCLDYWERFFEGSAQDFVEEYL